MLTMGGRPFQLFCMPNSVRLRASRKRRRPQAAFSLTLGGQVQFLVLAVLRLGLSGICQPDFSSFLIRWA